MGGTNKNLLSTEEERRIRVELFEESISGGLMGGYNEPGFPFYFIGKTTLDYLGYDSTESFVEDIEGQINNCIHPDDLVRVVDTVNEQLKQTDHYVIDYRIKRMDGNYLWVRDYGKCSLLPDGREVIISVVYDITKQKQEESRILAVEENLAISMEHANMIYWEYDFKKKVVYVNAAAQRMFGLPKILENYPESYLMLGFVSKAHMPLYRSKVREIRSGARYLEFDARIRTLQSDFEWMRIRFTGMRDEDGMPTRAICTAERIGEFKELEKRFLTTLQQNHIVSWVYDIGRHTILIKDGNSYKYEKTQNGEVADIPESQIAQGLCHPDDIEKFRDLYRRLDWGEKESQETLRFWDIKTEKYRWKRCTYTAISDRKGKSTYALGSAVDINDEMEAKKQYESAMEYQRNTRMENLLLSGHWNVTQNKLLDVTDLTKEAPLKKSWKKRDEFLRGFEECILDEEKKKKFKHMFLAQEVIQRLEVGINTSSLTCEICLDQKGIVRKWVCIKQNVIRVPETNVVEEFLTITDVTDTQTQKQILNSVIQLDYDYVMKIDFATDGMVIYQKEEKSAQFEGYEPGKLYSYQRAIESVLSDFVIPEDKQEYRKNTTPANIKQQLAKKEIYEFIYHIRNTDGAVYVKRARFASYSKEGDSVIMSRTDITDMMAKQEAQKSALQVSLIAANKANSAKSAFLSRVSHDMRTPLNGILGLTELMKSKADWSEIQKDLTQLELSGNYLLNLINDTLDVAKIENGRMELHPSVCDGRGVFENTMALLKPNLEAKQIQLHLHAIDLPYTILYLDIGRVEQLIMNIVGNAIKFTPDHGRIDFIMENVENNKEYLLDRVTVRDNGIGMKAEFLPHIFEPFSQEDTNRTSKYQGTGLGLTISKQIVALMGGDISVKSEPGKGTEFCFTMVLPKATKEQRENWVRQYKRKPDLEKFGGRRILVCEDHPLNAQITKRLLERQGLRIDLAENGKVGVQKFQESSLYYYDAVLMDIRMPVMDGIEATEKIRALKRRDAGEIPILAMTANALKDDVEETRRVGMNAHLSKPIQPEVLYEELALLIK